ncbi:ABC transporter permease [Streptomyces sp. NPDC049881]|uniref:ABC transporter permease n=1 Tax=unclassified Streptomyces TaxID=2593676 RepID=UPI003419E7A7
MVRRPGAVAGLALLALLLLLAGPAPLLLPDPDLPDYADKLAPPGGGHLLGTDQAGRDVAARIAAGARVSLGAAGAVWAVSVLVGTAVGLAAALGGRWARAVCGRLTDVALALPHTLVALAVAGALGPGLGNLVLALSVTAWADTARLAAAYARGAFGRPDVTAALLAGVGRVRAVLGHVVPGAGVRVLAVATLGLGQVLLGLAGLSFLGLGAQPPTAEWGQMLAESRHDLMTAPWVAAAPATAVFVTVCAAALLGDALRARVDGGRSR